MSRVRSTLGSGALARSAAVVIGLGIPAFLAHTLYVQRAQAIVDAEQRVVNTARVLEQHAARTIEVTDAYLRAVASLVGPRSADLRSDMLHTALREQLVRSSGISNIVVLDRAGRSIAEAAALPTRPLDISGRDYFRTLRDRPGSGLEIGQPIVGSLVRKLVLPIARRIDGPDGGFVGVVQAVLDAQAFQAVYDAIDNGPGAVLSLWRADGTLLVRSPHAPEFVGRNYAATENYQRYVLARDTRPFWSKGSTDKVERVIAIGFLDGYPLYVGAALSKEVVLAPWRRSILTQGVLSGGLTLVLVAALVLLAREMDRRRIVVAAIRESEARYRMLAENTSDVILRLTLDFKRTYISPSCERLFGHTAEEMLKVPPSAFIHPDDLALVREQARRLAEGGVIGRQVVTTYRARHKLGPMVWVEATLDLVRDAEGRPDSIVGVLRDVGARKADEALLQAAREEAERARIEAERASAAKGEFLAAMSHELRTPLNGVIGYSDLLCEDASLGPTARQYAERIRGAGSALLTVVDDILDFSKIEAGQVTITPRPFAVAELVDEVAAIVRASADGKGLMLHLRVARGVPAWVAGDKDRLRQILLNLLSNAVKFTREGWIVLDVDAGVDTDRMDGLRFSVSDTGIGIPADKRDRLFRRFSQVDGSISRDFGGTGLGLAISKALVELMDGAIGCESALGRGSTFWFEVALPACAAEAVPGSDARARLVRAGKHLLLAEDVLLNQELACAILERAGHTVDVVGDGAAAVVAVAAKRYDLVLMDVQMPTLDGMAATQRIRALGGPSANVPIVAMTANVLPEQVAAFHAAGMDSHVGKPFRAEELLDTIDRLAVSTVVPMGERPASDKAVHDDTAGSKPARQTG